MSKLHHYGTDEIDVSYDVSRCIHYAACVRSLPRTFNPAKRPWVDPDASTADEVAGAVMRCPTGALHFKRIDGGADEPVPGSNEIRVAENGPLYVYGDVRIETPEGEMLLEDTRVALCRCGRSKNKPFCDNSHEEVFEHSGELGSAKQKDVDGVTNLTVTPSRNGPLLLVGPVTLRGRGGEPFRTGRVALCRCGHSSNKPFCDGSHREVGFQSGA